MNAADSIKDFLQKRWLEDPKVTRKAYLAMLDLIEPSTSSQLAALATYYSDHPYYDPGWDYA